MARDSNHRWHRYSPIPHLWQPLLDQLNQERAAYIGTAEFQAWRKQLIEALGSDASRGDTAHRAGWPIGDAIYAGRIFGPCRKADTPAASGFARQSA
jgi:hypothetical protein